MTKKIKNFFLFSIALTFIVGFAVFPVQAQNSWQTFTSEEGGFSVSFPGKPQTVRQNKPTQTQGTLINTIFVVETNGGAVAYAVSYMPLKYVNTEQEEYAYLTTLPEDGGGRILNSKSISVAGIPGIEYVKLMPNGFIQYNKAFVVMSNRIFYQVFFTAKDKQTVEAEMKNVEKFFASFKLLQKNLSGVWVLTSGNAKSILRLEQNGVSLKGTFSSESMGESEILNGKVQGDKFSFSVKFNILGSEQIFNFTGAFNGNTIQGKFQTQFSADFTGTKER